MAEFPADATVDTAAPAEPMQLAQIEEKKPAEFKGFFEHGLDAKSRLFIPAKFREQLGPSFTLCFAPHVPALVLYPDEVWKEISERINASLFDEKMRKVQRRTMSSAFDIEADKQGRITIPAIFKRYAKLESACIISGRAARWKFGIRMRGTRSLHVSSTCRRVRMILAFPTILAVCWSGNAAFRSKDDMKIKELFPPWNSPTSLFY